MLKYGVKMPANTSCLRIIIFIITHCIFLVNIFILQDNASKKEGLISALLRRQSRTIAFKSSLLQHKKRHLLVSFLWRRKRDSAPVRPSPIDSPLDCQPFGKLLSQFSPHSNPSKNFKNKNLIRPLGFK